MVAPIHFHFRFPRHTQRSVKVGMMMMLMEWNCTVPRMVAPIHLHFRFPRHTQRSVKVGMMMMLTEWNCNVPRMVAQIHFHFRRLHFSHRRKCRIHLHRCWFLLKDENRWQPVAALLATPTLLLSLILVGVWWLQQACRIAPCSSIPIRAYSFLTRYPKE